MLEYSAPQFPTVLHEETAVLINDFFNNYPAVDTVLIVNSCARGQAVAESDLDIAILVKEQVAHCETARMEAGWQHFVNNNATIHAFKNASPYAHVHVDIIDGMYTPAIIENGEPIDYFEVEIGNQIYYAAPMCEAGEHFEKLQQQWLPYYDEQLRLQRLKAIKVACAYDVQHIPYLIKRELFFNAFDTLYKAFQKYLQALFIANKVYPLAYNKWIKYQLETLLCKPGLYPQLLPIIAIKNIESGEVNEKAELLYKLINQL